MFANCRIARAIHGEYFGNCFCELRPCVWQSTPRVSVEAEIVSRDCVFRQVIANGDAGLCSFDVSIENDHNSLLVKIFRQQVNRQSVRVTIHGQGIGRPSGLSLQQSPQYQENHHSTPVSTEKEGHRFHDWSAASTVYPAALRASKAFLKEWDME
jgi:hypothetical protein